VRLWIRQQSDYTICGDWDRNDGWRFVPHQNVLGLQRIDQDLLSGVLTSRQRVKVLKLLNDYNLNAFSLFDTDETLLETMWFREQVLKQ
jgi:hypothetical protein